MARIKGVSKEETADEVRAVFEEQEKRRGFGESGKEEAH